MPGTPQEPNPPFDAANDASSTDGFERLREILIGGERRQLDAARERIAQLEQAQKALPERLPAALEALDGEAATARVANALASPVSQALGAAVQRNRQSLIDVLFPIIGPLIRKSIAEALRNLVADLNGAIESSFTLRGLAWRMEAWRAGVPYAQVVLKHRLAYAIDHVFLIECETGLVLHHESAPGLPQLDKDAIAGMLTALGDFVGDSVGSEDGNALESARVGEHLVWLLHGPRANLACFIRGVPPPALHGLLEERLEEVHEQLAAQPAIEPDAANALWSESLQPMALAQQAGNVDPGDSRKSPSRLPLLLIVLALAAALFAFLLGRERWQADVNALRSQLDDHAGFVVQGIDSKLWRRVVVHGLLDPDAEPVVLDASRFGDVQPRLETTGYISTDDLVVARRAQRLLQPPASVQVTASNGVLVLDGAAPQAWIDHASERAGWIAGVARVEARVQPEVDAVAAAREALTRIAASLPSLVVDFLDETQPADTAVDEVEAITREARRAQELARMAGVEVQLTAVGTNTHVGSEQKNQQLRSERARWLALALAARGIGDVATDGDVQANRRVAYLRLTIVEKR